MTRRFLIPLLMIAILTGCVEPKILEQLGMVVVAGYDALEDDRILGTYVMYQFDPDVKENVQVISNTAYTSKGIRIAGNLEVAKKIASGQMRAALYSEELASEGIAEVVDTLYRDPSIGNMVYLGVVKGKAHDVLSHRYPEIANVGTFLYQTIRQNIEAENLPSTTLHDFFHSIYSIGKDPLLPYIEQRKNELLIAGLALFKDDTFVGTITTREGFFIKLIRDRFRVGSLELSIPTKTIEKFAKSKVKGDNAYLAIENIQSDTKIKLIDANKPEFKVDVKIKARLLEISEQIDIGKPEVTQIIENEINSAIKNEISEMIGKLQEKKVDPIGFGERYLSYVRGSKLNREQARELFAKSTININVQTTLVRTGIVD